PKRPEPPCGSTPARPVVCPAFRVADSFRATTGCPCSCVAPAPPGKSGPISTIPVANGETAHRIPAPRLDRPVRLQPRISSGYTRSRRETRAGDRPAAQWLLSRGRTATTPAQEDDSPLEVH